MKLPIKLYRQRFVARMGYAGFSFFIFAFFAKAWDEVSPRLENHEAIHYWQQLEMLFVLQWLWYGIEYLVKRVKYKSHDAAYKNLSFEREAYDNDDSLEYLKSRKRFAWIKYL